MLNYLLEIWYDLVHYVNNVTGFGLEGSVWLLIIFGGLLVLSFVLLLFFKKISARYLAVKRDLVYNYDKIFYLLAKAQYDKEIDKESVGGDPCIAAIKPLLNMDNPSYLVSRKLIKDNVKKVEILLGETVIDEQFWSKITSMHRKLKSISFFLKTVKILLVLIFGLFLFVAGYFYFK